LPPSYLKREIWRVVSAKKIETRKSRMDAFFLACAEGRRL
jgi:Bacteriocin-protection, YdeI or OmpD-Associated